MWGLVRRLGTLVSLLVLAAGEPAAARNVALLISVGQFRDSGIPALGGPDADQDALKARLAGRWQFAERDIRTLRGQAATRQRILDELDALLPRSEPGDTVLVYFSGHGTSASDHDNAFDLPFATGAWVPYDLASDSTESLHDTLVIGRRDLVPRFQRLDAGGRFVVVLSDSCYSGQVVRAVQRAATVSRFLPLPAATRPRSAAPAAAARSRLVRPPPPPYPYRRVLMLSAASDSEAAADISCPPERPSCDALIRHPTVDGQFHGAFTDALLRLLDGELLGGRGFTYADARQAISVYLSQRGFAQEPQILPSVAEDADAIVGRPFLGAVSAPTSAAAAPIPLRVRAGALSAALRTRVASLPGVRWVEGDADLVLSEQAGQAELTSGAGDLVLRTLADDADLVQRIAAEAWLRAVLPLPDRRVGLRAETDPGSRGGTFMQCERFVIQVALKQASFVAVLDLDPRGRFSLLYPLRPDEMRRLDAGRPNPVPGPSPEDRILVVPPFGTDLLTVIALSARPGFLETVMGGEPFSVGSARAAALADGLARPVGGRDVQQIPVRTYGTAGGAGVPCVP